MNRAVNLDTFLQIFKSNDSNLLNSFIKLQDTSYSHENQKGMSRTEIEDLANLSELLLEYSGPSQRNGYFLSYVVNAGIREEFDILRFSEKLILNIELKHELPSGGYEEIKDQLIRHRFLLNILNKENFLCTYLYSENKIFLLNKNDLLSEISIEELAEAIPDDYVLKNELEDIDLSDLIISPYSQPIEFSEHRYFLTDEQSRIRRDILKNKKNTKFGLIGGPGTGKSMLLIDLAKEYKNQDYKVMILFCASLPNANEISSALGVNVLPIKSLALINLNDYDIILVDEAQRLYKYQYDSLINQTDKKIIFSVDHQQTLHQTEKSLYVEQKLIENPSVHVEKLKEKVRTDLVMSSFIQKFLNLKSRNIQPFNYDKVNVVYFENRTEAKEYIKNMEMLEGYTPIELTEFRSRKDNTLKREKIYYGSETVHSVIGKEYDNVLVPLDKYFKYDKSARLVSEYQNNEFYPYFEDSCVFEALTRVKNRLLLVIVENPTLYITIQKILTWKDDKLYSK